MLNARIVFWYLTLSLFAFNMALGQGTQIDYDRMHGLRERTQGKVYRNNVRPNWLSDNSHFWYQIKTGANSHEYVFVDLEMGKRTPAFDHTKVAEALSKQLKIEVNPEALPINQLFFSHDTSSVFFSLAQENFQVERTNSQVHMAKDEDFAKAVYTTPVEIRPSRNKGGEIHFEVTNETDKRVQMVWIDRQGGRQPYQTLNPGESFKQHTFVGHVWLVTDLNETPLAHYEANEAQKTVRVNGSSKPNIRQPKNQRNRRRNTQRSDSKSPDGKFMVFVRDGALFLRDQNSNEERRLAKSPKNNRDFSDRHFFWSPNSKFLMAIQVEPGDERTVYMVESAPRDQLQPKLHEMNYLKPGDKLWSQTPRLFNIAEGEEVAINEELFANRWEINDYRWKTDSSEFSFFFNQRGHQTVRIVGINPSDGETRAIINEETKTFVDYTSKVFNRYLEATDEIIWMSERDGWNHLYLYDQSSGAVKNQITRGNWIVRGVDRVDENERQIWFRASGIVSGQDPYFIHHCRVNFDGSGLTVLTEGDGTHFVEYSPDNRYLIDTFSRVDMPPVSQVRRTDNGSLVCRLEQADWSSLLKTGWRSTIPFRAKGRDDETDIWGVIYLPTNFDESKTYPVIEYIYAGPHDSFVPKSFQVHHSQRELTELGFIVVQIDGMGTSNRSKAFHDVCWKNLGDSGFPDRIRWMKAAAEQHPQMDLSRVGIYGGSAGGQSSLRALLAHGDFYQVAVSDCGCHDNRMDKVWWNEQWMGYPIGPHYDEQSNVTNAHRLKGKLMLTVGELDRNVDPASTMQVVNALIQAEFFDRTWRRSRYRGELLCTPPKTGLLCQTFAQCRTKTLEKCLAFRHRSIFVNMLNRIERVHEKGQRVGRSPRDRSSVCRTSIEEHIVQNR